MKKPSDNENDITGPAGDLFEKIIGFGENSVHKSYYPALQENIAELKKAEEKYYNLFKNALNGIFQTTPDGKFISANQALARMFGYESPEELMNCVSDLGTQLYVDQADRERIIEILKRDGKAINLTTRYYKKDGSIMYTSLNIQVVYSETGVIEYFEGFAEDITKRIEAETTIARQLKELEEKNIALERFNEELRDFAYIASHDLQEPLRKAQNFCDMLKLKCGRLLDECGNLYLDKIFNENKKIRLLLNALLEYTMAARNFQKLEKVNLLDLINKSKNKIIKKYQAVNIDFEIDERVPAVTGDSELLQILFYNILDNSVKFRNKNIQLKITINHRITSQNKVEVKITDNGIGFKNEYSGKIFNLFEKFNPPEAYDGVGIGLPICRKIIHSHGGSIKAIGNERNGAEFIVTFNL